MPEKYPQFPEDLKKAEELQAELDLAIQKAKETGKTEGIKELANKTKEHLDSIDRKLWSFEGELPQKELQEQYESQKEILKNNNILETLSNGELGIKGIDSQEYPYPTLEEIKKELQENKELKAKMEQGFTEFQITPFGLPLSKLTEELPKIILRHKKEGKLFTAKKDPDDKNEELISLELDENEPLWVWDEYENADTSNELVYFPKEYSENHQGKTKQEILEKQTKFSGYLITLQEKEVNIPREGRGKITGKKEKRKQLETNQTPKEYLQKLQLDPQYKNESGLTPEEWISKFIIHLEKTNQVIDDYEGNGSASFNLSGYFLASGVVSRAFWNRVRRRASLGRAVVDSQYSSLGVRSGVRIGFEI